MNAILVKKNETEAVIVSGVANPSPAPALIIFNAIKLEKLIICVNTLIVTALVNKHAQFPRGPAY